jgi:hypothetical protein
MDSIGSFAGFSLTLVHLGAVGCTPFFRTFQKKTRDDFFRKQVLHTILPTPVVRRSRYPALQTGTRRTSSGQEKRQGVHHACQAQSMKRDRASTYALARPYNSQTMPSV